MMNATDEWCGPWMTKGYVWLSPDVLVLVDTNGLPKLELPALPGSGPIEGMRGSSAGVEVKRGGRHYFLAYEANDWTEAT